MKKIENNNNNNNNKDIITPFSLISNLVKSQKSL